MSWLGRWLAPVLILVGIVFQLTVLNGLRLPGGGVPDLVLVLVAVLAMTEGPVSGMIIGFAAGLCLDLAPPGSAIIGQYALVFCLAGWASGRLSAVAGRSAARAIVFVAAVVAVGEALAAALGLVLEPSQVTLAEVRHVLPVSIGYDVLLSPFVLYLVALLSGFLAEDADSRAQHGAQLRSGRHPHQDKARRHRVREPRIGGAARLGDGWLGGGPGHHPGAQSAAGLRASTKAASRLRPARGVAGSASGLARHRSGPVSGTPQLRLAGGRRGDGTIGNAVGTGFGRPWQPGRHPGLLAGSGREFRPQHGELGGSAARTRPLSRAPSGRRQSAIRFGAHRGDASIGQSLGSSWLATPGRGSAPRLRLAGSRSPALGRQASASAASGHYLTGSASVPRLRMGASRLPAAPGRPAAAIPRLNFRTRQAAAGRRRTATPKFRRRTRVASSTMTSGLVAGGALDHGSVLAARRRLGTPRLRLGQGRRSTGTLGTGTFASRPGRALRRSPARLGKQPRFGYGRRSLVSRLAGTRFGGRRLARAQAGRRSGAFLLSRRTGGQL